jgi:LysR family hydrogen peroxide-inducible transcriptional activator
MRPILRKLEQNLGVTLFQRANRRVAITPIGAKTSRNQLAGPFRLSVIPTLAPFRMPRFLGPLRKAITANV